jgi:hypothetical protein
MDIMTTKMDPLLALHSSFGLLAGSLAKAPNGPTGQTHPVHIISLLSRRHMLLMLELSGHEITLI